MEINDEQAGESESTGVWRGRALHAVPWQRKKAKVRSRGSSPQAPLVIGVIS